MRSRISCLSLASLLALTAVACKGKDSIDGTRGKNGRVDFKYQRSCFFGCPLEQPLLEGTRERIELSEAGDVEGLSVESSDTDVVELALERNCYCEREADDDNNRIEIAEDARCEEPSFPHKRCDNSVLVGANAAGTAEIVLHDPAGDLLDRADIVVNEADRARFLLTLPDHLGAIEGTDMQLAAGESAHVEVTLYDDDGRELLAPEGVTWQVDDPDVAIVTAWLLGSGAEVHAGLSVDLEAMAQGATTLRVVVPGLEAEAQVDVSE